jgi:hypothetical protein
LSWPHTAIQLLIVNTAGYSCITQARDPSHGLILVCLQHLIFYSNVKISVHLIIGYVISRTRNLGNNSKYRENLISPSPLYPPAAVYLSHIEKKMREMNKLVQPFVYRGRMSPPAV